MKKILFLFAMAAILLSCHKSIITDNMTEAEITEKIASELCKQCPGMVKEYRVEENIGIQVPVSFDGDVEECIKDFMKKNLENFDRIEEPAIVNKEEACNPEKTTEDQPEVEDSCEDLAAQIDRENESKHTAFSYYNQNMNVSIDVVINYKDEEEAERGGIKATVGISVSKAFIPSDQYVIVK